jgi:hypothetical protein
VIILGHIFTFKHLCLHSITKILRNGPKAHFPFIKNHLACLILQMKFFSKVRETFSKSFASHNKKRLPPLA